MKKWVITLFTIMLFCGLSGFLIGYGKTGTLQGGCLYAGYGLIAVPVLAAFVAFLYGSP